MYRLRTVSAVLNRVEIGRFQFSLGGWRVGADHGPIDDLDFITAAKARLADLGLSRADIEHAIYCVEMAISGLVPSLAFSTGD